MFPRKVTSTLLISVVSAVANSQIPGGGRSAPLASAGGIGVGQPFVVGNRLIYLAVKGGNDGYVALDRTNGRVAWRLELKDYEDFATDGQQLWAVTAGASPASPVVLRVDPTSGQTHQLVTWTRGYRFISTGMAHAGRNLYVLTIAMDGVTIRGDVLCIDPYSGNVVWQNTRDVKAEVGVRLIFGLLRVRSANLVYSVGRDIWTVRLTDGVTVDHQLETGVIQADPAKDDPGEGPVYYANDRGEIVSYNPALKTLQRFRAPERDRSRLLVRAGILFSHNSSALFAHALNAGLKWRVQGKFLAEVYDDSSRSLWAFRDDNVLLRIDASTGKILHQQSTIWRPLMFNVLGQEFYAVTSDGRAYSLKLQE